MHIAVYIPKKETCDLLSKLLQKYELQKKTSLSCHFFDNELDLLCDLAGGDYDVFF